MEDPTYEDCYKILGLTPDAKLEEVTWAFRKLLVKLHPNCNPGVDRSRFDHVFRAYQTIMRMQRTNRRTSPHGMQPRGFATTFFTLPDNQYPQKRVRLTGDLGVALVPLFVLLTCGLVGVTIWAIVESCSQGLELFP